MVDKYFNILDYMDDAIHIIDRDCLIVFINKKYSSRLEELGLKTDIIGQTIKQAFPYITEQEYDEYCSVFKTGRAIKNDDKTVIGNKEYFSEVQKIPIIEEGRVVNVITIIRDITEEKKIQAALITERNKLQSLINSIEYGLTIQDQEYNIIFQNEYMNRMFDHLGEKCYRIYEFREKICAGCPVEMSFKDGISHTMERKVQMPDGKTIIWENTATPLRDAEGNITACLEITRDITKRKEAEVALYQSEMKYRRIVDTANEGVWVVGPDTRTVSVNTRMAEMFGLTPEEMIGRPFTDFMFEEDIPDHLLQMEKRHRGIKGQYERRFRHRDGQTVWTLASASPLLDEERRFEGSFAMFTDITERKQIETKLNEQLLFLQQLLDAIPIPVYYKDVDGVYLGCNAAFETLMCMPRSDIVGKTVYELIPRERAEIHHEADLALIRNPGIQLYEVSGLYKDGKYHDVIFNKATFVDADNRVAGIVSAAVDITERKQVEEALLKLNEELDQRVSARTRELQETQGALMNIVEDLNEKTTELEEANAKLKELDRLKSMFIASMSHELRTPLNSIIGFSSILHDEWLGPVNTEQKENLAIIRQAGRHLLNLINDVIDVSKVEAGKIESNPEEFDLHDLILEAVNMVRKDLEDKGLVLQVEVVSYTMHTDRRRLLQCVLNLLTNAVKYTEKGSIALETRKVQGREAVVKGDIIEISVTDTGIGIREEELQRLFQPFVRLGSPIMTIVPGTGLGLYLSKKLAMEVLKGEITATSEFGRGSRFVIRVPVRL